MTTNADGRGASDLCDQLGPLVEAAGMVNLLNNGAASCVYSEGCHGVTQEHLERFAELVRARAWQQGYNDAMTICADHMRRVKEELNKPLPAGWANHAHHLYRNVSEAIEAAPANPALDRWQKVK